MGFLDNIKDRLGMTGGQDDNYYDDGNDGYDDYYDEPASGANTGRSDASLLGNSSRPEVDSVAVYTRSGRPVSNGSAAGETARLGRVGDPYAADSYGSSYDNSSAFSGYDDLPSSSARTARVASAQLPPYVLRPTSYDDVQTVVSRVGTNQPVVLSFKGTNIECAKRILDFSLGLACGLNGEVQELGDRAFVVLPAGLALSDADVEKLRNDGVL